ncbi:hypothetical protein bsdcttw_17890 [Anaerocolumna chitinilytica]|uniref:Uncharacterized protein n=1 Tax=Anaerocolumna chitinilytica TaxID=1727145 RepID=A0A7I8DJT8_9FIRM|nr:hypothetical protein bsdcttw_17890 [Anaerocolumna chitinilytica]
MDFPHNHGLFSGYADKYVFQTQTDRYDRIFKICGVKPTAKKIIARLYGNRSLHTITIQPGIFSRLKDN